MHQSGSRTYSVNHWSDNIHQALLHKRTPRNAFGGDHSIHVDTTILRVTKGTQGIMLSDVEVDEAILVARPKLCDKI